MYSVIRFTGPVSLLRVLGASINDSMPGTFDGIAKRGDSFAIAVSNSASWVDHRNSATVILRSLENTIHDIDHSKIRICFDVACEPMDYESHLLSEMHFDSELLSILTQTGTSATISIYAGLDVNLET